MTILSAQSIRKQCLYFDQSYEPNPNGLIHPFVERGVIRGKSFGLSACSYDCRISDGLLIPVGQSRLASTLERFCLPNNICGSVLNKSSWIRISLTTPHTLLDPGWEGHLTIMLSNLGTEAITFEPGDPVCQIKFEWLDFPTELLYSGKYQFQGPIPTPAKSEE